MCILYGYITSNEDRLFAEAPLLYNYRFSLRRVSNEIRIGVRINFSSRAIVFCYFRGRASLRANSFIFVARKEVYTVQDPSSSIGGILMTRL